MPLEPAPLVTQYHLENSPEIEIPKQLISLLAKVLYPELFDAATTIP
ncbi:MAG: hypothetical protein F6J90_24690 [Moorea sp. SIOASIH]|nr:hypothetical protein [Moorena sp. SIOASIH]NEO39357.1 hypothetical protein [Moorena sp. SIOASIH]